MLSWLLDTNVLSEVTRPQPDAGVLQSMAAYQGEMAIPAPVWHELRFGWLRMPQGRRRDAIGRYLNDVVSLLPLLPYDGAAARIHAEVRADAERAGRSLAFVDGQIAAIAMAHGLTLVTRNHKDFAALPGLRWVSWWGVVA